MGDALLGTPAISLVQDPRLAEVLCRERNFLPVTLLLRGALDTYNEEERLRLNAARVMPDDYVEDNAQLLLKLKAYAQMMPF